MIQLPIDRALLQTNEESVHQVNLKQDLCKRILAEYERQEKIAQLITAEGRVRQTRIISADETQVVIILPDSVKVGFNDRILLVLYRESRKYVIQGFVKKLMFPKVVLAFADPRIQKRWPMNLDDPILQTTLSDKVTQALGQFKLKMVRRVDQEKEPGLLNIQEFICSDVQVSPKSKDDSAAPVTHFNEEKDVMEGIIQKNIPGRLHDLSVSGAAIIPQKGENMAQPGKIICLQFPMLSTHRSQGSLQTIKMTLFGIIRYRRPFMSGHQDIFGVKFIQSIDSQDFLEIIEQISQLKRGI